MTPKQREQRCVRQHSLGVVDENVEDAEAVGEEEGFLKRKLQMFLVGERFCFVGFCLRKSRTSR